MAKLTRLKNDRVLFGVCSGIGEYFGFKPTLVRLVWIGLTIVSYGAAIIAYIIACILMPVQDEGQVQENKEVIEVNELEKQKKEKDVQKVKTLFGIVLVSLGTFMILRQFVSWISFKHIIPLSFILIGIFVLYIGRKEPKDEK